MKLWLIVILAVPNFAAIAGSPDFREYPYPAPFKPRKWLWKSLSTPRPRLLRPASDWNFGEIAAVATNSKGHVFILSRSNATGNTSAEPHSGFRVRRKGQVTYANSGHALYGFAYGHGVRWTKTTNIWVVDKVPTWPSSSVTNWESHDGPPAAEGTHLRSTGMDLPGCGADELLRRVDFRSPPMLLWVRRGTFIYQ